MDLCCMCAGHTDDIVSVRYVHKLLEHNYDIKLRLNVPAGLFAGISGAPASGMFSQTFYGCTKLSGIDENVFGDLTGAAQTDMFTQMFYGDNKLYGNSPRINGKYLYEIWPNATQNQVGDAFYKCSKLSDYKSIPTTWR